MSNDALQQLLSQISAQTGKPMPDAAEVQSFLSSPGSRQLMQAIAGATSPTLSAAASLARSGEFDHAAELLRAYLHTPEGQQLIGRISGKGGTQ